MRLLFNSLLYILITPWFCLAVEAENLFCTKDELRCGVIYDPPPKYTALVDKLKNQSPLNLVVNELNAVAKARTLLAETRANNALVVLNKSKSPEKGLEFLSSRPTKVTIVFDIPSILEDIEAIHGKATLVKSGFDANSLARLNGMKASFCEAVLEGTVKPKYFNTINLASEKTHNAPVEALEQLFSSQEEDELIIVIGHSSNGHLQLHKGNIAISKLRGKGPVAHLQCLSVVAATSEPGATLASGHEISYQDAFRAARLIAEVASKANTTLRDIALALQNGFALDKKDIKRKDDKKPADGTPENGQGPKAKPTDDKQPLSLGIYVAENKTSTQGPVLELVPSPPAVA